MFFVDAQCFTVAAWYDVPMWSMPVRTLFLTQLFLLLLIAVLHLSALALSLYWLYPWFDVLLHFLGGVWVFLALVWLAERFRVPYRVFLVFLGVLFVGVGWEVFELLAGIPREANFVLDTSIDLLMDSLGGITGVLLTRYLL